MPVANTFVALILPEFRVAIFPIEIFAVIAVRVFMNAVAKDKMFPRIFVTVVDASVVEPAVRLSEYIFVDVELVIVPFVITPLRMSVIT